MKPDENCTPHLPSRGDTTRFTQKPRLADLAWLQASGEANSIEKVTSWQRMANGRGMAESDGEPYPQGLGRGICRGRTPSFEARGRTPSFEALTGAVKDLSRLDDYNMETLGAGFFSDVYKVEHKTTGKVMVLKMNKYRSNRNNSLREIQLMNKLKHPNILRYEAVCVHEGQLHALTEYISGGNLEQLIKDTSRDLAWSTRIELSLHIAKGLMYLNSQGFFHRDLTSKNILIKVEDVPLSSRRTDRYRDEKGQKLTAVIGDFGLATKIPKKDSPRLPQVGSPYWMSPECLRGERYDHQADIFSFGVISCELIARCDADPDVLPRTQNFGVDYRAFSEMCPNCPPEYLKIAFTCLSIDPSTRPRSNELVSQLKMVLEEHLAPAINVTSRFPAFAGNGGLRMRDAAANNAEMSHKKSPSEKARIHSRHQLTVKSVGEEMCLRDPHYTPRNSISVNPFALLPRLREGRKLVCSTDLFSSCFEMPSPRVSSPIHPSCPSKSLPSSPTNVHKEMPSFGSGCKDPAPKAVSSGRVTNLKKLYSASSGGYLSQDDSVLGLSSSALLGPGQQGGPHQPGSSNLKRWGSVESGVYSVSEDWFSGEPISSTRSICSSLLTVSDLEEDLRMASQFLARKRSSSVFTDSLDDLSTRLDDLSNTGTGKDDIKALERGYEKDIRDIVEYFERNCKTDKKRSQDSSVPDNRSSPEIARSQKIESLIMAVAENKNRAARLRRGASPHSPPHLQVCHGIVQSKLQIFDHTKRRQPRPRYEQSGFVKARRAMFDAAASNTSSRKHLSMSNLGGDHFFAVNTGAIPKKYTAGTSSFLEGGGAGKGTAATGYKFPVPGAKLGAITAPGKSGSSSGAKLGANSGVGKLSKLVELKVQEAKVEK